MNNLLDAADFDAVIGFYNIGSLDRRQEIWTTAIGPEAFTHIFAVAINKGNRGPDPGPYKGPPVDFERVLLELEGKDPYDWDKAEDECPLGMSFVDEEELPEPAMTSQDIARFFNERNRRLDISCAEDQKQIVEALTSDVMRHISEHADSYEWNRRMVEKAMKKIADLNPALIDNTEDSFMFKLAAAVTSQNQDVFENFASAYHAYRYWKERGELPTNGDFFDGGVKTDSMEAHFEKVNRLLKDHGYRQTAIVLAAPISVKDLETYLGVKASAGLKGDAARGSIMLGPKVGACFGNLNGLFDDVTATLWFTRTMNQLCGNMFAFRAEPLVEDCSTKHRAELPALRSALESKKPPEMSDAARKTILSEIAKLQLLSPNELSPEQAMRLSPTLLRWVKKVRPVLGSKGTASPIYLLAKRINQNFTSLQDAPRTGSEHKAFRQIAETVRKTCKAAGVGIKHADLQKIYWDLETRLFAKAKQIERTEPPRDYLDAAYITVGRRRRGDPLLLDKV